MPAPRSDAQRCRLRPSDTEPRPALGFVENSDDPQDRQAWCYACELVYQQEQDMTARFRVFVCHAEVCSACYDEIKAHHDFDAALGGEVSRL